MISAAEFAERAKVVRAAGLTVAELSEAFARIPPPSPEELELFAAWEAKRTPLRRLLGWFVP